ncbi:unnamed protein product, partial [Owenia fusiformis]
GFKFHEFMQRNGLMAIDMYNDLWKGPNYTFSRDYLGTSYIDHCVISSTFYRYVNGGITNEDELLNTSDHLSLVVNVNLSNINDFNAGNSAPGNNCRNAWDKLSKCDIEELFTKGVSQGLAEIKINLENKILDCDVSKEYIDSVLNRVTDILKTVSNHRIPKRKYNKRLKPYWNSSIKDLLKAKNKMWSEWKRSGMHRGNNVFWLRYKDAKRAFRRALRQAEVEYNINCQKDIDESQDIDARYYWFLANRHKKSGKNSNCIRNDHGIVLQEPDAVRQEWSNYFSQLFTPKECDNFDIDFKAHVNAMMDFMKRGYSENNDGSFNECFDENDLAMAIKSLNLIKHVA